MKHVYLFILKVLFTVVYIIAGVKAMAMQVKLRRDGQREANRTSATDEG